MVSLHAGSSSLPLLLDWEFNLVIWAGLLTAGWLYARGMGLSRGTRRSLHPWWRPVCYYAGLSAFAVALLSPMDHLASALFTFHMAQHLLLTLVGAPLVLLGAPMVPVLRGIPRPLRRWVVAPALRHPLVRRPLSLISQPIVAWSIYVVTLIAWHTSAGYDLALRNEVVHDLEHFSWSAAGILFWWNVIDPVPLRSNLSYLGRIPYVFVTTVPNFALAAFITFAPSAWYPHYSSGPLPFGLTAHDDQQLAGLLMWIPGGLFIMGTFLAVLLVMVVTEERQQQAKEARALADARRTAS